MSRAMAVGVGLAAALLLAGCGGVPAPAGPEAPASGKRYGLEFIDTQEALQRGEGREALNYYEREAAALDRRGEGLQAAKAYTAVAFVALRLGAFQNGIRSGLRALELLELEPRTDETRGRQCTAQAVVGFTYLQAGDLGEAQRHLRAGMERAKGFQAAGPRQFFMALSLRGLATVALVQGDFPAVRRQGEEAVRLLEDRLARFPPYGFVQAKKDVGWQLAYALILVGNVHRRMGNPGKAETFLSRALAIAKGAGLPEVEANAANGLGWIALSRKDPALALGHFREALALATPLNYISLLMYTHSGIAWSYFGQGRHQDALAAFHRSMELVEDVRGQLQEAGLRSGFLEDKQWIYHGAVRSALALRQPAEAFSYAERARARAFLDLLGTQTVLSKGRTRPLIDEEVRLRARLAEARALASADVSGGVPAAAREQAEAAQQAYRAFLDRVRRENLEQVSLMTVEPVTLQEVQARLPAGTTLLEYLVTDTETLLWVIDRDRADVIRIPLPRAMLVVWVRTLRQAIEIQLPLDQVQQRAREVYDLLLASARPLIRGDRLVIVPHDVLHYLPFGALRTPEDRWLVEEYTLATLPSASVLKYLPGKGEGVNAGALAVGNPDVGPALNLRYAEREARAVGEHYPGATMLVRQQATEAAVKARSGTAALLHFATHGELNEQDPLSSALLLVPGGQDDGRLEVREIFGLDLQARLVILSACETGLGQLSKGDELVGLQRAFLYAGTPAVVTTLWKVDDRASFRLMEAFYANLHAAGPAAALRQAQRATMAEFPHPFAWAGFGLTGEPR